MPSSVKQLRRASVTSTHILLARTAGGECLSLISSLMYNIISSNYKIKYVASREFWKQRKYTEEIISLSILQISRDTILTCPHHFYALSLICQSYTGTSQNCHIKKKKTIVNILEYQCLDGIMIDM